MPTTTITIPADIGARLDSVAQAQGSTSQDLALEVIRAFLAAEEERRLTHEAISELDRGEGVDADQVRDETIALLEQHGVSRAAIRAGSTQGVVAHHQGIETRGTEQHDRIEAMQRLFATWTAEDPAYDRQTWAELAHGLEEDPFTLRLGSNE